MRNLLSYGFAAFLFVVAMALPEVSFADPAPAGGGGQSIDAIDNAVCGVIGVLQGPIAKGIAAFGIIFLGFSLFLGKISWGTGIALAIGLGAVLGAGQIVSVIGDGEEACDGA